MLVTSIGGAPTLAGSQIAAPPPPDRSATTQSNSNTALLVGCIVGGVVFGIMLATIVFLFRRRRKVQVVSPGGRFIDLGPSFISTRNTLLIESSKNQKRPKTFHLIILRRFRHEATVEFCVGSPEPTHQVTRRAPHQRHPPLQHRSSHPTTHNLKL